MKIANKISLSILIMAMALTSIAVPLYYHYVSHYLEEEIDARLDTVTHSRGQHIETYLHMLKQSTEQLSKSVILEIFLKTDPSDARAYKEAFANAMKRLKNTKEASPSLYELFLLDSKGRIVASTHEEDIGNDKSADAFFTGAQKQTYIKDAYYSDEIRKPEIDSSSPMFDTRTGELIGVVVARLDLSELNSIVSENLGFGKTGEMFIVNKYGYMITPSKFIKDTFLKQKVDTLNTRMCLADRDKGGSCNVPKRILIFPDYRGVRVVGSNAYIKEMQWCLICKIEASEAFVPLAVLRVIAILLLVFIPFIAWIFGVFISGLITEPIHKLHRGTEIIGEGNLDYRVGTPARDEIGQLSRAFDQMTHDLKNVTASRDELNKEMAEREKAEEGMRRLASIVQSSWDAIYGKNLDGTIITWNRGAEDIYGYQASEIVGKNVEILAPPDRKNEMKDILLRIQQGERVERFETMRLRKDGQPINIYLAVSPIIDKSGKIIGASAIASDITRQKKAEEELKAIEARYKIIYEASSDAIMIIYRDGRFYAGNPTTIKMFGCKDEADLLTRSVIEMSPEYQPDGMRSDTKALQMVDLAMKRGAHSFEWVHRDIAGKEFYSTILLTRIELQGAEMIQATVRDITELKRAQEQIMRAAEEWQRTFDSMSDIVFLMDTDSNIIKVNKAFNDALGKKLGNVIGKKCYEVMHKSDKHWPSCPLSTTYNEKRSNVAEVDDPTIGVPLLVTTSPLLDEKGNMVGVVHVAKDISEIKKAQETVNEAIAIKEQFISIASHELRAPMGIIKESVEILGDEIKGKVSPQAEKFVSIARRNILRLERLSTDILDFQKLDAGMVDFDMKEQELNQVIREASSDMKLVAKEKGLDFSVSLDGKAGVMKFDKDKITEVLVNLINNAIKFTEKGGITVSSKAQEDGVMVSVSDTGPGIAPEEMPKIFQAFQQASAGKEKKMGSGLGLAICEAIIKAHGGRIWVESERGKGSTFSFFLPAR